MAVTIKQSQQATPRGTIEMLAGNIYPLYTTWNWITTTPLYTDFKYQVKYKDETEEYVFNTIGEDDNNWSKISLSDLIKNKSKNTFQPKVNAVTANKDGIKNYQAIITPFNNGDILTSESASTFTSFSIKSTKEIWHLVDFLSGSNDKMLVDVDFHYYNENTYATNKALYGYFGYTYGGAFKSKWDKIIYEVFKYDGTILTYELLNALPIYTPTSNYYLTDTENLLVDIPVGPANIRTTWFNLARVELLNGYVFLPNTNTHIHLNNGDKYRYAAFDGTTQVSKWYNIEVKNCTTRYTPMAISWLNSSGAYDTFEVYAKSEKSIEVKNKTYQQENNNRVGDFYYVDSTQNRGDTIYNQETKETWTVTTDWLSDAEVSELEDFWASPDIYVQINEEHYPVNNITKKVVINNKENLGLFKYQITLQIANKKIRI